MQGHDTTGRHRKQSFGDDPCSCADSTETSHAHGSNLVTNLLHGPARFYCLGGETEAFAEVDLDWPATPPDEGDAEVHRGSIEWSDTAHGLHLEVANGLRGVAE